MQSYFPFFPRTVFIRRLLSRSQFTKGLLSSPDKLNNLARPGAAGVLLPSLSIFKQNNDFLGHT